MESLIILKNKYVNDITTFLNQLKEINFYGTNTILYEAIKSNVANIKKYNQDHTVISDNIDEILKKVSGYKHFLDTLDKTIINISNVVLEISNMDTSGIIGTFTPIVYSKLECNKKTLIIDANIIIETIISLDFINKYKFKLLDRFNKKYIEIENVKTFISQLNKSFLTYVKNNESVHITNFIYDVYNSIFYYINGKQNQKIINNYITNNIDLIKQNILITYEKTLPNGEFSLNKLQFFDNAKHNIPQKLIQTNNLNPSSLYKPLGIILQEKLDVEIPKIVSKNIINDEKLFNNLNKILSKPNQHVGFIIIYKSIAHIEQQIFTMISSDKQYINYISTGVNKKLYNNTSTIRYLEKNKIEDGKNEIKIYNNEHIKGEKNIFYVLDTVNNIDFRFLSMWDYGSHRLTVAENDVQFILNESYPKIDIEIYNNIISESISQHINLNIDKDVILNIDTSFIAITLSKITTNLKNIALPYISKFNKSELLSEIKNKQIINEIISYLVLLLTEEFEDYIFNQTILSIKRDLLTYFYMTVQNIKKTYYKKMIEIIDSIFTTKIINLSRSSYYSNSEVLNLYFIITDEILKNFVSIRDGAFILIKKKIELMNVINDQNK